MTLVSIEARSIRWATLAAEWRLRKQRSVQVLPLEHTFEKPHVAVEVKPLCTTRR